jgi:GNAT superfamily N-acetyltransferase
MIQGMNLEIRPARERDAGFLAWVQQEAARSHLSIGFWDLAFPGPDKERLRLVERIARARARSFCHWAWFLIADLDGRPVAGLCAYTRHSVAAGTDLLDAIGEVLAAEGWGDAEGAAMQQRIDPFLSCVPDTSDDAWVIEWVATRPEHRGKGVIKRLLNAALERGRERGHALSQISVLIGNTPAQRAYESVGFRVLDEKRDPGFEAALGCPGIRRLHRP